MSLNLHEVAGQLHDFSERLTEEGRTQRERIALARQTLENVSTHPDALLARLDSARTSWLLARPMDEAMNARSPEPPRSGDYVVLATDGSQIDVDRHIPVRCYLLNLGWSRIGYGSYTHLTALESRPSFHFKDEDLYLKDEKDSSLEERIGGAMLSSMRSVAEIGLLADLVEALPVDIPTLALLDGTLVLWGLSLGSVSSRVQHRLLDDGVLKALARLRELARRRPLTVASYISYPGGSDLTGTLRLAACPTGREPCPEHGLIHQAVDCQHCPGNGHRPCDEVNAGGDRYLFQEMLAPGERSALFLRHLAGRDKLYARYDADGHGLAFFYLRMPNGVPDEIARVELPSWIAEDEEKVRLAHALILDQCRRGLGYPVAIMEAHEQAVISGADRGVFRQMLEGEMARQDRIATSGKRRSKESRRL